MYVMNAKMNLLNPFNLKEDDYDIENLAQTLSRMCRFWSQTKPFYSVAQHCLEMDNYFQKYYNGDYDKNHLSKMALIHEVFEGMTGLDIPSPYKHLFKEYVEGEKRALSQICRKYDVPYPFPEEFKKVDTAMMVTEAITLIEDSSYWREISDPLEIELSDREVSMEIIEQKFLCRWEELFGRL